MKEICERVNNYPANRVAVGVGVLARSNEPESYAGWTSRGPGRDTHARQVKGLGPDKEQSTGPPGLGVLHRANNPIM